MSNNQNVFGERLIKTRESNKENQQQLASNIGITQQTLSRYENGERTPTIDILVKIAQHYDISTDYLLGLTDTPAKDMDIDSISRKIGLSESVVERLIEFKPTIYGNVQKLVLSEIVSSALYGYSVTSITTAILTKMINTEILNESVELFCKTNDIEEVDEIRAALNDINKDTKSGEIILPVSCLESDKRDIYLKYVEFLKTPINENGYCYGNSLIDKGFTDYMFDAEFNALASRVSSGMYFNSSVVAFVKNSLELTKQTKIDDFNFTFRFEE